MNRIQIASIPVMAFASLASLSIAMRPASAKPSDSAAPMFNTPIVSAYGAHLAATASLDAMKADTDPNRERPIADLLNESIALGKETVKADWGDDTEYIADLSRRITDVGSTSDWAIVTDTKLSRTCVFRSFCGAWICVERFDCAVGSKQPDGNSGTFSGSRTIDHKAESTGEGNSWWSCTVPCWGENGEDDGQGFHDGFDGTTGMITHGCTRLSTENAKYIYDNVPVGSRVLVI